MFVVQFFLHTGCSKKTVTSNFSLTDLKITKNGVTQSFLESLYPTIYASSTCFMFKWPKMAQNGPKWPKVAQNGPNSPEWPKMAQSGWNGPKWPKVAQDDPNGPEWPKWQAPDISARNFWNQLFFGTPCMYDHYDHNDCCLHSFDFLPLGKSCFIRTFLKVILVNFSLLNVSSGKSCPLCIFNWVLKWLTSEDV